VEQSAETPVQHIGRYEVLGELGTGGMAVVYRAHDPRLDRDVAVKVLHPHLAKDPESRARFEREARAAARLRHPNIVEVYEFSDADERESFMVTELLEGPTLRRFVELNPDVLPEIAALIGVVLCDALSAAHAQGVVHRDVKPDNLMLQRGKLKLTDFGIAHVADNSGMTLTGQVLGSPAHMAPEQIEGTTVDARTDVFATGTVLYLLSVGKLPFEGTNTHSLLRKILDGDYPDPVRAQPLVGHRFAQIIRKALARNPSDRYASADALKRDLIEFVKDVGWEFPEQELSRYFADPQTFVTALKHTLRERLSQMGVDARRANNISDAMGYFNRALALEPNNPRVIALVRSVARRRQMQRAVRATGIVSGVALVTALVAVGVLQRQVRHKPRPAVVMSESVETERQTGTVIVRATQQTSQEPDVEPDAQVAIVVARVPVEARSGSQVRVIRSAPDAMASQPSVEMREVMVVPFPRTVVYSFNGGPATQWDSTRQSQGSYQVGQRIHVVVSGDNSYERLEWNDVIPPGEGPFRLLLRLRPTRTTPDAQGTAAVQQGSTPLVN
jgi:eukaryotic-like serine/threonine-protein kinase